MNDIKHLILPHLQNPSGYEGVRPLEEIALLGNMKPNELVRLNGNENSFGPSPKVAEALGNFKDYNRYPDPEQRVLRESLSGYLGVSSGNIVAGNGSDELIDLIIRMFVGPGDNIIEPTPTFGMYRFSANLVKGNVISVPRNENFELDVQKIASAVDGHSKVIFIASPNNPTGNLATKNQIAELLQLGIVVVVDEAYHEYCGETVLPLLVDNSNLIILRTFSKWAGLAGLRVGLGVMNAEIARLMMTIKPPYNMNRAAEVALLASLEDKELLLSRITPVIEERKRLSALCAQIDGIEALPSQANYVLIRLPEERGKEVYLGLADRGVFVRYYNDPNLVDCIRVSVGQPHETDRFIMALKDLLEVK